jgi:acyl carrier protein
MEEFYEMLAEKLEVDSVSRDSVLEEYPAWDSLTVLAVLAVIGARYKVMIDADEIAKVITAGDLEDLVKAKANG